MNTRPRRVVGTSACINCGDPINVYENSAGKCWPRFCSKARCRNSNHAARSMYLGISKARNKRRQSKIRMTRWIGHVSVIVDAYRSGELKET